MLAWHFIHTGIAAGIARALSEEENSSRPTEAEVIETLPQVKMTRTKCDGQCVVCQENFVPGDDVTSLPCKHRFHRACVVPWLEKHHTCPTCRFELPKAAREEPTEDRPEEGSDSSRSGAAGIIAAAEAAFRSRRESSNQLVRRRRMPAPTAVTEPEDESVSRRRKRRRIGSSTSDSDSVGSSIVEATSSSSSSSSSSSLPSSSLSSSSSSSLSSLPSSSSSSSSLTTTGLSATAIRLPLVLASAAPHMFFPPLQRNGTE